MPLVLYEGPEGAGKTALMTDALMYHHRCGGKVYAFPGYELTGSRGKVLSTLLMPEQLLQLINDETKTGYAIGVDEINNFFNHHHWQNILNDFLTSAMTQRRKRAFAFLATVTAGRLITLDVRSMFHEIWHCLDAHAVRRSIPRGKKTYFTREDTRGLLSGRIGTRTPGKIFDHQRTWNHFKSFSPVDPKYLTYRIKMQKEQIIVDSKGQRIDAQGMGLPENTYLPRNTKSSKLLPIIEQIAEIIKDKEGMAIEAVQGLVRSQGIPINSNWLGRILKQCGVRTDWTRAAYVPIE